MWKVKLWLVFPLLYPTQSDATFNCRYTAPNYTSGFNNIHLQCAQQNCMDTPLILHCALILGQYKILERMAINWQWVSRPTASFFNTWQIFKKNMISSLHCNCKNMSAGMPWLLSASAVSSNYSNYALSSFESFMANISVSMCEL